MTVYEATNRGHYEKLIDFIVRQPAGCLPRECMRTAIPIATVEFVETIKKDPEQRIFWVEDENGVIHGIIFLKFRRVEMPLADQPQCIATFASICISAEDFEKDNTKYHDELLDHLIRTYSGFVIEGNPTIGEFQAMPKYHDWARRLFGDSMMDIKHMESPIFGTVYRYRVDFKKYLGLK